jgi:hypothetical protein
MTVNISYFAGAGWQFFDNNGNPLTGGLLYTYAAGTTTPAATYTSNSGLTLNANPIVLDSAGRVPNEIWLTYGATYKFALYTSTNVLIGTWDNIDGITPASYIFGEFANTSDVTKGDALVGFKQSNSSGALTGAVGSTVHNKLQEIVSFKDFGAVGDGTTNDAAAIQAAINALSAGGTIDGQGLTYKVNSVLSGISSNTRIQNATFDFSSVNNAGIDYLISASGSLGATNALTANTLVNSNIVKIADTSGFAVDDLVFFKSNTYWSSSLNITYSLFGRVKSIDSPTQLTLYSNVLLDFTTADSAAIYKVSSVKNVTFDNIKLIGGNAGTQAGIYLTLCENANIVRCQFEYVDYVAVALVRCYNSTIDSCRQKHASSAGNAYGYAIWSGCYGCSVINSWGENCRHTVTIGGSSGSASGVNFFNKIIGCQAIASKDAGFDSHANSMYTEFIGNYVEMSADRFLTSNHDGIINEGAHAVFTNNTVVGPKGVGVYYNPAFTASVPTSVKIIGNTVTLDDVGYGTSGSVGCYVLSNTPYGANIESVVMTGNTVKGGQNNVSGVTHFYVFLYNGSRTLSNLVVANNASLDRSPNIGCYIRVDGAASTMENVFVQNNALKSVNQALYFYTNNASATMKNIVGGGNILDSSTNVGLYLNAASGTMDKIKIGRNIIYSSGSKLSVVNATNYILEDADIATPITFTGSPASVSPLTNWYIFNRGASITLTLPDPTTSPGRILHCKNIQANAVDSASSNVVPIDSATAGTSILPNTDGAWATLYCDGTNWVIMAKG